MTCQKILLNEKINSLQVVFNFQSLWNRVKNSVMKNFLVSLLILLIFNTSNANELENTLNKVYDKGSDVAESYISNLLDGPGDTECSWL